MSKTNPLPLPGVPKKGWAVDYLYDDVRLGERMADEALAAGTKPEVTFEESLGAAAEDETSLGGLAHLLRAPSFKLDKNYSPTESKEWMRLTKDVPPQYHSLLLESVSAAQADHKRQSILDEVERGSKYGFGTALGMAAVDPGAWLLSGLTGGTLQATKLSRMKRFLTGGGVVAAENAALEAILVKAMETRDESDVMFAGLVGFGIGGPLSAVLKPRELSKLTTSVQEGVDQVDRKVMGDLGVLPTAERDAMTAEAPRAKVLTREAPVEAVDAPKSAWDQWEADNLSVPKQETHPPEFLAAQEAPQEAIVGEPNLPPQKDASVQPEAPTQTPEASNDILVSAGDNITVELPDGRVIGGRVKSFNEGTGYAVIDDEMTGKPVRVNLNEVDIDEIKSNEGFIEAGSVGSAQVLPIQTATPFDAMDPSETALTHFKIPFTDFKVPIRFDYYAKFLTGENSVIKRMAKVLLADPVGDVDHAGRGLNASELASMDWHMYKGRFHITANDAFDGYAKDKGWSTVDRWKKGEEFYEAVTRGVRDYSTNQYSDPHVGKVVMEVQKIHKEMLELAQKHGVKGADEILPDPSYMMRKFAHEKIIQMDKRFGPENMIKLVKGAIKSVRPVTEEMAERIARNYYKVVRGVPYEDMSKLRMGDAGKARARIIAEKLSIDPDIMDEVFEMALSKPGKVEGDSGRLKSRTLLNENFKMRIRDTEGKESDVSMEDLFENDSRVLMDLYTRQMSGHIGLAKMGIRSDADFDAMLREAHDEAINSHQSISDFMVTENHMRDVYNSILGRPMSTEVYGKADRIAKAVRDLNFIRMMGQVGFAQLAEIGNTLGYAGLRAMSAHMPSMREVIKMAKGGQMDDQLARDLINMGGLGGEMASMHPVARSADDAMFDVGMTKAERGLAMGRHAVAMVSGLAPITNMLRQVSSRAFVQKFSDYARGLDKIKGKDLERMAHSGIRADNKAAVFRDIKKYSTVTGKTGTVDSIDWEKWSKASPETYETFRLAIWRESRRVVQEQTIGETAPWMHSTVGKILTQFRGFMLVAHGKQTLYALHHADLTAANAFLASTMFAGMAYVAQNAMNFAGNPEELDKRLSLDEIAKSAFQRNSMSALIPATVDTLSSFAGWEPIFKYGRSTGLASGMILGNPSVDLIFNKVGGTASNFTQMATTDDFMWTQGDVKNAVNIIVPNLMGVKTLIEAASTELPKYNTLREYQQ